ncbi:MAG: hypothetical protein RBT39_03370 [Azoarcus sp.]|jgi:hypothetical protein|nr:hypothetical protein [Azoarcus sp.]
MVFPLLLPLCSSRAVLASVFAAHCAAGLALFIASRSPWLLTGGCGLILLSALAAWHGEMKKRGAVLALQADGGVSVQRDSSAPVLARPRQDIVVFSWIVWFVLELPDTGGRGRERVRFMLVRHNLRDDQWRSLQIWLRHRAFAAPVEPSA